MAAVTIAWRRVAVPRPPGTLVERIPRHARASVRVEWATCDVSLVCLAPGHRLHPLGEDTSAAVRSRPPLGLSPGGEQAAFIGA